MLEELEELEGGEKAAAVVAEEVLSASRLSKRGSLKHNIPWRQSCLARTEALLWS